MWSSPRVSSGRYALRRPPRGISHHSLKGPQVFQLASALESGLPIHPSLEPALLTFAGSVLMAGEKDMSLATGPGRAFILRALETAPDFTASLLSVLAQLGWTGWTGVAQPLLLRNTSKLLEQAPKRTLRLLAKLVRMDKFGRGGVDIVWKRVVSGWATERLTGWQLELQGSEENGEAETTVQELHGLLALSPYVERMHALLIDIVEHIILQDGPLEPAEEWHLTHANRGWVLGACMRVLPAQLARCEDHKVKEQMDRNLGKWTKAIVKWWSWSECAVDGLAVLLQSR